jgi:NADH-quinone oxidoreductase subunit N
MNNSLTLLIPELFLFGWAMIVLLVDLFSRREHPALPAWLTLSGLVITAICLVTFQGGELWRGMYSSDPYAFFFKIVFLGAAFLAVGSSFGTSEKMTHHRGEYFALIMLSTVGMMFLASARELITLYIGLELTTIPLFVLVSYTKSSRASTEAGLKYMIIGAVSSAVLLYGMSIVYGMTGLTTLARVTIDLSYQWLLFAKPHDPVFSVALIMIIAGLGFKLALVPFHMWAPDVYEGSPTPVTAFLSVGSKAAGLAAFVRIFCGMFSVYAGSEMAPRNWGTIVAFLAAVTMIVGNVIAIRQTNIKRMLAYSSIAQAGYIMVGVVAASAIGIASISFYIFSYLFANMGAFAIVTIFAERTGSEQLADYAGFSKSSPVLAALLSIFMLSLAGIPPLAGFLAKYYVFAAAIEAGYLWLVIIALLTAVVSLYYYANVIRLMYFVPDANPHHIVPSFPAGLVLTLTGLGVVIVGLFPQPILHMALNAATAFIFKIPPPIQ